MGGVSVNMFEVVGQRKQNSKSKTGRRPHQKNVAYNRQRESLVLDWSEYVCVDVQQTKHNCILSALDDIVILHN